MEPIILQDDHGLRTTDFFDIDSSSDDQKAATRKRRIRNSSQNVEPDDDYIRGAPSLPKRNPEREGNPTTPVAMHDTSGSPSEVSRDEPIQPVHAKHVNIQAPGRGRIVTTTTPRSSTFMDDHSIATMLNPTTKEDQILGAHAITLQALLGDRQGLQASSVRNSRDLLTNGILRNRSVSAPGVKAAGTIPPPISIHTSRQIYDNQVRTPYPMTFRRQHDPKPSPLSAEHRLADPTGDVIIALSIAHRSKRLSELPCCTAQIVVPAVLVGKSTEDKGLEGSNFDDHDLFVELRAAYAKMTSRFRFLSARQIGRVQTTQAKSGLSVSCACAQGYCGSQCSTPYGRVSAACNCNANECSSPIPLSSRYLAHQSTPDGIDNRNFMAHFRRPRRGKAHYEWTRWMHQLASIKQGCGCGCATVSPTLVDSQSVEIHTAKGSEKEEPKTPAAGDENKVGTAAGPAATLELVEGWSLGRIAAAIILVIVLALAAALLWLFLGVSLHGGFGFRGAGSRVSESMLVGLVTLLLGWTVVAGWIGISWMVD